MSHFVRCSDGKEREIFPAKIKDREKIRHFSVKFNSTMAILNILAPDNEKIERAEKNQEEIIAENMFANEPYDAMMEIMKLAFGEKYSIEELEEFLDVESIAEILEIFYGMSNLKKKANANRATSNSMNLSPQL